MKRTARVIPLVFVVALAVSMLGSCAWFLEAFNNLTVDGERGELDKLYVVRSTNEIIPGSGAYEYRLYFTSEGLEFDGSRMAGSGDLLMLYVIVKGTGLSIGTYAWSSYPADRTIMVGAGALGMNITASSPYTRFEAFSAQMELRGTLGDGYAIQFEGRGIDNSGDEVEITARYRGKVTQEFVRIGSMEGSQFSRFFGSIE